MPSESVSEFDYRLKHSCNIVFAGFDQGMVFYNNKQWPEAIKAFDDSFHLNPSSDDTVNYLKLAQQEEEAARQQQARQNPVLSTQPRTSTAVATTTRGASTRGTQTRGTVQATGPAQITTSMTSAVNDGYIMVKVGSDIVAHENLWQETGRFLLKRRIPKDVNVTKDITPKNADVDIWVIIPSMDIQEHHIIKANFQPGVAHHLTVAFDPQSKTFNYQMN